MIYDTFINVSTDCVRHLLFQPTTNSTVCISESLQTNHRYRAIFTSCYRSCLCFYGQIAGGAVGLVVAVPELIFHCTNLDDCETEGSMTLRQNAQVIRTASDDMEKELQAIQ